MTNEKLYKSRKKIFLLGTGAIYGKLAVSTIVGIISVPIGLHYFGPLRYGVWIVISSIFAYLSLSNFGIGAAVLTLIGQFHDPFDQRIILRRSIGLLTAIGIIFITLTVCVSYLFPGWIAILGKVPSDLQGEATKTTFILIILYFIQFPVIVFGPTFSGLQEIYWTQIYDSLSAAVRLVSLIATILIRGNLVTLALFTGFGVLSVGVISGIHLFLTHPDIRPRLIEQVANTSPSCQLIFTSGIRFFLMGIAVLVIYNTDNLIISHYLGPLAVTSYAITFQLFTMGFSIITAGNLVLWPMHAHAVSSEDWTWIQQTCNCTCQLLVILGGLLWIGGIAFVQEFITLWVGPAGYSGLVVIIALGGYGYMLSLVNTYVMLLNGLNRNKNVVIIGALEAVFNLGISLILVKKLGIGGVALGTFLATLMTSFWLLPLDIRYQTAGKVKLYFKSIVTHAIWVMLPCLILVILTYLYVSVTWMKFIVNIFIITIYLVLSWYIMPLDVRNLVVDIPKLMRTSKS